MSFPTYHQYKPSPLDWVGDVPKTWGMSCLKRHFAIVGGSTPKSDVEEYWDGDTAWITPTDLSKGQLYLNSSQRRITASGLASCGTTLVPEGSLILSTRAPIGSIGIAARPLCTNQGCKSLVPVDGMIVPFAVYLLTIAKDQLNLKGKGTTFLELSGDELGSFAIPLPPLTDQKAVVAFLDRETAKIDELIAEQQRFIELLKEKRQAVISHAVTKGLDPSVPMKDSGVEWLGQVPAHWSVLKASRIFNTGSGTTPRSEDAGYYADDGFPWINTGDLPDATINEATKFVSELAIRDHSALKIYPAKSVIIAMYGATIGKLGILNFEASVNQACCVFHGGSDTERSFLFWTLLAARKHLTTLAYGGGQPNINQEILKSLRIPLPATQDMLAICHYLQETSEKYSSLIENAESLVTLLQERRAALISAAVTGKIDVRSLVAADAVAA